MRALNHAIADAAVFSDILQKLQRRSAASQPTTISPEVAEWNAEVERKRAEKKARKFAAKVKP